MFSESLLIYVFRKLVNLCFQKACKSVFSESLLICVFRELVNLCFQKALKEKDEHIEQLLRERDLERSDVARSAAQVDEVGSCNCV